MTEVDNLSQPAAPAINDIRKAIVQQLESLRLAGLSHLPAGTGEFEFELKGSTQSDPVRQINSSATQTTESDASQTQPSIVKESATALERPNAAAQSPPTSQPRLGSDDAYGESLPLNDRKAALQVLRSEIEGCTKCDELSSKRTQTVFGVGNPAARLVFVGEGPGFHEDRTGEPFVGDAGDQLNKIIKACKLSRDDLFILNCVKCRPPGNRNPADKELANCWGYAEQQLEILQPEFIVCLGSVAAKKVLQTTQPLGKLRRKFHSYRGSRVLVTYHPAYLLRTPSAKRHVWEDMKMLMKEMGVDWTK